MDARLGKIMPYYAPTINSLLCPSTVVTQAHYVTEMGDYFRFCFAFKTFRPTEFISKEQNNKVKKNKKEVGDASILMLQVCLDQIWVS